MVLTVDKLNLQVAELQKQYSHTLENFSSNVVNFCFNYQANLQQLKAQIDLVHNQIGELVIENQKIEKEKKVVVKPEGVKK